MRAVLLFVLVCGLLCGCRKQQPAPSDEKPLTALEAHYHPKYALDDHGRVTQLWLEGPEVDAESLDAVSQLSELRNISLYGARLTDASLGKLTALKWVETIGLGGTPISDQGLEHLEKLRRLRQLWLPKSDKITQEQVNKLKKALPSLTVHWQAPAKK